MVNENIYVSVYKFKTCKFDQPFLSFVAKNIFIGKSMTCELTQFSGAGNNSGFDGNTILLECEDSKYICISGHEISEFTTSDKIIDYISLMGNNLIPYAFAIGEKYTYFIYHRYKFIENEKVSGSVLEMMTANSMDPYDNLVEKYDKDVFKRMEANRIHSSWAGRENGRIAGYVTDEEDEEEEDIVFEENIDIRELEYTN